MDKDLRSFSIEASNTLFSRAVKHIPCGTQTLAKGPSQHVDGVSPKYIERGAGCHVWDVDGNEYIDYSMAIGPVSLGYSYPAIDSAIVDQLKKGITFSLMSPLEVELSEKLSHIIPNAEAVRFSKTGCDVTSAAIRLARNYTKREKIVTCGYHGWHDWAICTTSRNGGIPKFNSLLNASFKYNDLESLKTLLDSNVAAVIMEPMLFEFPHPDFLDGVRELCNINGSLLIFDEMWTGFRFSLGGAQEYFGVNADLCTFSKAIANGMPISVLSGKWDVMKHLDNDVFFFTTFGGECLSIAAALATIKEMECFDVIKELFSTGSLLVDNLNKIIESKGMSYLHVTGHPSRSLLSIKHKSIDPLFIRSILQQEMAFRGILWQGQFVISYSHSIDDIKKTCEAFASSIDILDYALSSESPEKYLYGTQVSPVFRTQSAK